MAEKNSREFKILSIDGGGIKGVYSAWLLAELESQRGKGEKLSSYFDMMAGTSTGSLIALGLAAGKSAKEIAMAYETDGPLIFCDHGRIHRIWRTIRQTLTSSRYGHTQLEKTLTRLLEEKTLADSLNYVCVPITVISNYTPRVYKTRHSINHSWKNVKLAHIALASAAAPTFFPMVDSEAVPGTLYADGGLFANNPSLIALIEAFRVFVGPDSELKTHDTVSILSIGSFPSKANFKTSWWRSHRSLPRSIRSRLTKDWRSRPARGWMLPTNGAPPLVDVLMQVQGKSVEYTLPILRSAFSSKFSSYVRLDAEKCKSGRAAAVSDLTAFSMADGHPETIAEMKRIGSGDGLTSASDPNVSHFFDTTITPVKLYPHPTT